MTHTMDQPSSRSIAVTAGVIVRDGRVLVCQRPPGSRHPGKWEFPGGKLEPGESLVACMRRELQEELGIDAEVGRLLWQAGHQYSGGDPIELMFFLIPRFTGVVSNREFAAIEWITVAALSQVDFLEGDREFVAALASGRVDLGPHQET